MDTLWHSHSQRNAYLSVMANGLHIGYDAKRVFFNHTGLGNYGRNLLHSLAAAYPENQYHLYTPKVARGGIEPQWQNMPFVLHQPHGLLGKLLSSVWRSVSLGSQLAVDGIQLYHGLSNELPLDIRESKVRSVVTIHDLIFLDHPELYPSIDRRIYRTKSAMACERADHIIAISEQTKQSIIRHFGTREGKISVVHQSCDPVFLQAPTPPRLTEVKNRYQLPDRYFLYVGSIAARKQTLQLVEAFSTLQDQGVKLLLVGKGGEYLQQVRQLVADKLMQSSVIFLQDIPTADLPAIYQQSLALVYPSLMEGFGIPIIEALHSGTAVITTEGGCFQEAGGDAALYVPPTDTNKLAQAMETLAHNEPLRHQLITIGKVHAQNFTPQTFAHGVMAVYGKALA